MPVRATLPASSAGQLDEVDDDEDEDEPAEVDGFDEAGVGLDGDDVDDPVLDPLEPSLLDELELSPPPEEPSEDVDDAAVRDEEPRLSVL